MSMAGSCDWDEKATDQVLTVTITSTWQVNHAAEQRAAKVRIVTSQAGMDIPQLCRFYAQS